MTNRKSPTSFPMSLRWTSYVASNPPKWASKATIFSFSVSKIGLFSKKVCYKVSLRENFQQQSCKAFIGLSILAQTVGGGCSLLSEILDQSDPPPSKTALPSSTSITASEKSSIITDRKSTMRFPMILRWTSYPAYKPPKGGLKTQCDRFLPVFARYL